MSILQDFEIARKIIGSKKYDAIEDYLNEICPPHKHEEYKKELRECEKSEKYSPDDWISKNDELKKKHGIVFLDQVLYNQQEWAKFDVWYKANVKQSPD